MIPYFQALFIQCHGMISALMIYGQMSTLANSKDTDEMPHDVAFNQVYTVC